MKLHLIPVVLAAVLTGSAGMAHANELVLLDNNALLNNATVTMEGNGNRLEIVQSHTGGLGANSVVAAIYGDLNGGPLGAAFSGAALRVGLEPGKITQSGFDNRIQVAVNGSGNLFAFSQTGSGNSLTASITGQGNQAAVLQHGTGNHAGISQNGTGNVVGIMQYSW